MMFSWIFILLIIVMITLVCAGLVAVGLAVGKPRKQPGQPVPPNMPSQQERMQTLRQNQDRYTEERSRILAMVDDATLTADDADRLFVSLERETTTMSCPYCSEDIRVEAAKCKHCKQMLVHEESTARKPLTRSVDRKLSGVCGGIADYLNMDPTLVRVLTVLATLFTSILPGLLIYIVAACIMPEPAQENTPTYA